MFSHPDHIEPASRPSPKSTLSKPRLVDGGPLKKSKSFPEVIFTKRIDAPFGTRPASEMPRKTVAYQLLPAAGVASISAFHWLVKGVLPSRGLAVMYGASGSSKSFLALDLSAAIAQGAAWFGHRVTKASVVYVCLEGSTGIRARIGAWEAVNGRPFPELFRVVFDALDLRSQEHVKELAEQIRHWVRDLGEEVGAPLVVIDTLNRAMPGADENLSGDMSDAIDACAFLADELEGLVLLVHHTGKTSERGPRGHSSLLAAMDAALLVTANKQCRSWVVEKAREAEGGLAHDYVLQTVSCGVDDEGDPIESCVVEPVESGASFSGPLAKLGPRAELGLTTLVTVLRRRSADTADERTQVPLEDWRVEFYAKQPPTSSADSRRKAFHAARDQLARLGCIAEADNVVTVLAPGLKLLKQS